jgi:hypothetical protein
VQFFWYFDFGIGNIWDMGTLIPPLAFLGLFSSSFLFWWILFLLSSFGDLYRIGCHYSEKYHQFLPV